MRKIPRSRHLPHQQTLKVEEMVKRLQISFQSQPCQRVLRHIQVHRQSPAFGRSKVRHANLRSRHLIPASESLLVQARIRTFLHGQVRRLHQRNGQHVHPLDQRVHSKTWRRLQ